MSLFEMFKLKNSKFLQISILCSLHSIKKGSKDVTKPQNDLKYKFLFSHTEKKNQKNQKKKIKIQEKKNTLKTTNSVQVNLITFRISSKFILLLLHTYISSVVISPSSSLYRFLFYYKKFEEYTFFFHVYVYLLGLSPSIGFIL